ncbi:hypothetical protein GLYMA_08G297750v4 [Glycine max]|nr:hypothetical protein GLYMA_08G297750v4 [Glycine max]KAH1053783.1 hypothetical protein GYH30_022839 [Glycine max]
MLFKTGKLLWLWGKLSLLQPKQPIGERKINSHIVFKHECCSSAFTSTEQSNFQQKHFGGSIE